MIRLLTSELMYRVFGYSHADVNIWRESIHRLSSEIERLEKDRRLDAIGHEHTRRCLTLRAGERDRANARVRALEESLRFAIDVIAHEVPPETCTCNACGDCAGAFYFAENMLKARALLPIGTGDGT